MKNTTDKTFSALPPVTLTLDPLTGLLSRNSFLEQVRIRLDQDTPKDWCIATIDLEHFKLFNDWYGQEAGDRLLKNIADYLKRIQDCYHYTPTSTRARSSCSTTSGTPSASRSRSSAIL